MHEQVSGMNKQSSGWINQPDMTDQLRMVGPEIHYVPGETWYIDDLEEIYEWHEEYLYDPSQFENRETNREWHPYSDEDELSLIETGPVNLDVDWKYFLENVFYKIRNGEPFDARAFKEAVTDLWRVRWLIDPAQAQEWPWERIQEIANNLYSEYMKVLDSFLGVFNGMNKQASGWIRQPDFSGQFSMEPQIGEEIEAIGGQSWHITDLEDLYGWFDDYKRDPIQYEIEEPRVELRPVHSDKFYDDMDRSIISPTMDPYKMELTEIYPSRVTVNWERLMASTIDKIYDEKIYGEPWFQAGWGKKYRLYKTAIAKLRERMTLWEWEEVQKLAFKQVEELWVDLVGRVYWQDVLNYVYEEWEKDILPNLDVDVEDDVEDYKKFDAFEEWRFDNEDEFEVMRYEAEKMFFRENLKDFEYFLRDLGVDWWSKWAKTSTRLAKASPKWLEKISDKQWLTDFEPGDDAIPFLYDPESSILIVGKPNEDHFSIELQLGIDSDYNHYTYGRIYPQAWLRNPETGVEIYHGERPFEARIKAKQWLQENYGVFGDSTDSTDKVDEIDKQASFFVPITQYQWVPLTSYELSGWEDVPFEEKRGWFNRADRHNQRARRFGAPGGVTARELWALNKRFEHKCVYCGKYLAWGTPDATLDHVRSLALGGSGSIENVVPACFRCNHELNEWDRRNNPQIQRYVVPHPEFGGPYVQHGDKREEYKPHGDLLV